VLPSELAIRLGDKPASELCVMLNEATSLVFDLIRRHDIDCDPVHCGYIQGAVGRRGRKFVQAWHDEWAALGAPVTMLSKADVCAQIGTDYYDAGVLDERGGNVQPLSYCRGLAEAAIEQGAHIHGASAVTAIERSGTAWQLSTAGGSVEAQHVLFATNGYTDELWRQLKANVVPVKSVIVATAPLADNVAANLLREKRHVSETLRVQTYYCLDRDNRLVFGGRGDTFGAAEQTNGDPLRVRVSKMFPQLGEIDWQYCWGGYVAMTADHTPKLLQLGPGVYAGMGYNGRGVAMATLMGKLLSACVLGQPTAMPITQSKPIPLHALHKLGIAMRVMSGRVLDQWDRRG
jgi:glycine/D-amino acid oxidase-like deaminating enzyme